MYRRPIILFYERGESMPDSFNELGIMLAAFLPNLLIALAILIGGWLIAFVISKLVENLLHRTSLDDRLAGAMRGGSPDRIPVERGIALVVFWIIMLFVILTFLNTLNLGAVSRPVGNLLNDIVAFLPNLLAAAALTVLAFVIATVLRLVLTRVLSGSMFSQRISDTAQVDARNRITIGQTIGTVVYWLVLLLFLPAILDALELQGILAPVQGMVDSILGTLPNIFGAALVLIVGYFVARIVRQIVANLLDGVGVNRLGARTGANAVLRENRLSDLIATIVFVLILIPVAIAALNILNIPAISGPASDMLTRVLNAIPAIFGAFLLLAIAYFIARLVGSLVSNLLSGVGFNRLFAENGPIPVSGLNVPATGAGEGTFRSTSPSEPNQSMPTAPSRTMPSDVIGWVVMIAILLFAAAEAANMLGFETLTVLIGQFVVAAWNILFGLVIFAIGLWLSTVAYRMIRNTGTTNAHILATAARIAILVFAGALALRQMGIAESIVNLAFGLMLGAVAVAAAIAFGIGGRSVAADLLERWRGQLREQASRTPPPIPQTGSTGMGGRSGTSGMGSTSTMGTGTTSDFTTPSSSGLPPVDIPPAPRPASGMDSDFPTRDRDPNRDDDDMLDVSSV